LQRVVVIAKGFVVLAALLVREAGEEAADPEHGFCGCPSTSR
jgi:hypothetical protein